MSTKTKMPMGLLDLTFVPIASESAGTLPTYEAAGNEVSLGHAVRAALAVTTDSLRVYGDDALQIAADLFVSATLDTETLLSDLQLEAKLFGGTYATDTLTSGANDAAASGGVYFVRKLMKKDKTIVYRAVILFRCQPDLSSYAIDANTRGANLELKNNAVRFLVSAAENGDWKWEGEYSTESASLAAIAAKLHPVVGGGGTT